MNNEILVKNVAYVRRKMCLGQNEFAKECDINPGNFSRAMTGKKPFSEQMLMNIARVGGITYEELTSENFITKRKKGSGTERTKKPPRQQTTTPMPVPAEMAQLKKENEMLKAQIERQEEEIQFYRSLLLRQKNIDV